MPVFDSHMVIDHLNGVLPPAVLNQGAAWMAAGATISVMTRIEGLGSPQTAVQCQQATALLSSVAKLGCPKR